MRRVVSITALLTCLLTAGVLAVDDPEWGVITDQEWQLQPPADYPDAGAVVIFDHGRVKTEESGMDLERHCRIKIFGEAGAAKINGYSVEYYDYDHFHHQEAQIVRSSGEVIKIDEDAFIVSEMGSRRKCRVEFPPVAPGDIVEFAYRLDYYGGFDKLGLETYFAFTQAKSHGSYEFRKRVGELGIDRDIKNYSNIPTWFFDHQVPTLESRFEVQIGAELDYTFFTTNVPTESIEPTMKRIKVLTATAYKKYTWLLRDIAPLVPDSLGFYDDEVARCGVHFQLFSTPGENRLLPMGVYVDKHFRWMGQDIQGFLDDYTKTTKTMRKKIRAQVGDVEPPLDRMRAIYSWIQSEFALDTTGYELRPRHDNMKALFKKQIGMPFELNILLVEALKIAGLDAWPVLISTVNKIPFRKSGVFNHMLAMVDIDGRTVFLDASAAGCEPGTLLPICLPDEGVQVDYSDSRPIAIGADVCKAGL
ncbi:MAG: DUF3857 domain-containing protein [bacterium]